jgi:hypothetical protein
MFHIEEKHVERNTLLRRSRWILNVEEARVNGWNFSTMKLSTPFLSKLSEILSKSLCESRGDSRKGSQHVSHENAPLVECSDNVDSLIVNAGDIVSASNYNWRKFNTISMAPFEKQSKPS